MGKKVGDCSQGIERKEKQEKIPHFTKCDLKECQVYLFYKKHKNDPSITGRRQLDIQWMDHPSLNAPPCQSDVQHDGDGDVWGRNSIMLVAMLGKAAMHPFPNNLEEATEFNMEYEGVEVAFQARAKDASFQDAQCVFLPA